MHPCCLINSLLCSVSHTDGSFCFISTCKTILNRTPRLNANLKRRNQHTLWHSTIREPQVISREEDDSSSNTKQMPTFLVALACGNGTFSNLPGNFLSHWSPSPQPIRNFPVVLGHSHTMLALYLVHQRMQSPLPDHQGSGDHHLPLRTSHLENEVYLAIVCQREVAWKQCSV